MYFDDVKASDWVINEVVQASDFASSKEGEAKSSTLFHFFSFLESQSSSHFQVPPGVRTMHQIYIWCRALALAHWYISDGRCIVWQSQGSTHTPPLLPTCCGVGRSSPRQVVFPTAQLPTVGVTYAGAGLRKFLHPLPIHPHSHTSWATIWPSGMIQEETRTF